MNRVLIFLISLLFLVPSALAFDVYDSNDVKRTYFSLTNDDFVVKSSTDSSVLELKYDDGNVSSEQELSFNSCGDIFCAGTSLVDFISSSNLSLGSMEFRLVYNDEVEMIYLDIDEPQFEIISSFVDNTTDELKVQFNYSDNFEVKNVAVYERVAGEDEFIKNITSNSYSQKVDKVGSVNLFFVAHDVAGNKIEVEESFFVDDIFEPEILETFVTLNDDGKYDFYFKIADSSLKDYELTQGSLKVTGSATGSSYESTITIPYTSGSFNFKVYDSKGNFISKTISLSSPFDVSISKRISNDKDFEFKTTAESCHLTAIDSEEITKEFKKNSDLFSLELNIDEVKEYTIDFYCENNNIKQYFSEEFYYDTNKPQVPVIELEADDRGYIIIEWDEVEDEESDDIDYELYKDDDRIYSGSKNEYTDKKVKYPIEYEYYLVAIDEAGNEVDSSKEKIVPKKTDLRLSANIESGLTVETDTSKFKVQTDVGSDIEIFVRNDNTIVHQDSVTDIKENEIEISVKLKEGINEIQLKATDVEGNVAQEVLFLTYAAPVEPEPTPQPVAVVKEAKIEETQPPVVEETQVNPIEEKSYWYWWALWIIIFAIFIWYFVFNENRLKERMAHHLNANRKTSRKSSTSRLDDRRNRDKALAVNLKKIQKEREDKHFEKLREEKRAKEREKKPLSALEKQKMDDISKKKRDQEFVPKEKPKPKRREPIKESRPGFFATLFSVFNKEKEEKKDDPMSNYIHRQKSAKSWDDPRMYRQKYHDDLAAEKLRAEREKEEERKLKILEAEKEKALADKEFRKRQEQEMKERNKKHGIERRNDIGLEDYLNKRTKKRRFLFAEREVDRDIKSRGRK